MKEFAIDSEEIASEPFHYRACGLDDVYLLNGFTLEETDYGAGFSIHNVDGLHRAIGLYIVSHKNTLSAREVKFLRREMDITQLELANKLGVDQQTVARYEKDQTPIPGPADRYLRVLYVLFILPENIRNEVLNEITRILETDDSVSDSALVFKAENDHWILEAG
ncbi:MAG: helix-turn-helix domain-containing protein [Pseudomonadota bacterium]